jgi:hypothetical protein
VCQSLKAVDNIDTEPACPVQRVISCRIYEDHSGELKKIPYLDTTVIGARTVKLMPLWDSARWRMWFDTEIGIIEGQMVDAIESDYVAKEAAKNPDLFIPFVHPIWQHASFPEIVGLISAISDDFHNMGTSVARLKHFWRFQSQIERGAVVRFASTELEYLVALCRTVFDLLQETFSRLWASRVRLADEEAEKFRKTQTKGGSPSGQHYDRTHQRFRSSISPFTYSASGSTGWAPPPVTSPMMAARFWFLRSKANSSAPEKGRTHCYPRDNQRSCAFNHYRPSEYVFYVLLSAGWFLLFRLRPYGNRN